MQLRKTSIGLLLSRVHDAFGEDCWHAPTEGHASKTLGMCEPLKDVLFEIVFLAEKLLQTRLSDGLEFVHSTYCPKPGPLLCGTHIKKRGSPYSKAYIEANLIGRHPSGVECIQIELHIGYEHINTYRWLVANWRRPLWLMLQPLELELWDNGFSLDLPGASKPEFRGKDILRRVESYLERSEGDDNQCFSLGADIKMDTSDEQAAVIMAVFLAIHDSLTQLLAERASPDCLLKHFLDLRSHLPRVPFRATAAYPQYLHG